MAAASHVLHHILHRRPPPPPLSPPPSSSSSTSLLKPLFTISSKTPSKRHNNINNNNNALSHRHSRHNGITTSTSTTLFAYRSLLSCHTLSLASRLAPPPLGASPSPAMVSELDEEEQEEEEEEEEDEDFDGEEEEEEEIEVVRLNEEEEEMDKEGLHSLRVRTNGMELPSLSVKEKKELASYAHSLGKKLKSQLVGKSGVTSNVATSFVETLEANELLKIKIHRTCPGELEDVVKQLEELTCSVVVGKIGRTVILYRPSLTKLKAEEKKRQFQKIFLKRKLRARPAFQAKGAGPRFSGRGRRGSSRVSTN